MSCHTFPLSRSIVFTRAQSETSDLTETNLSARSIMVYTSDGQDNNLFSIIPSGIEFDPRFCGDRKTKPRHTRNQMLLRSLVAPAEYSSQKQSGTGPWNVGVAISIPKSTIYWDFHEPQTAVGSDPKPRDRIPRELSPVRPPRPKDVSDPTDIYSMRERRAAHGASTSHGVSLSEATNFIRTQYKKVGLGYYLPCLPSLSFPRVVSSRVHPKSLAILFKSVHSFTFFVFHNTANIQTTTSHHER